MRHWGCVSFIVASSFISSSGLLIQRSAGEHVILANCIDNTGLKSSQMAYFSGSPGASPSSVASVSTPYGQTRVWEHAVTSATFPDGDTFTANISVVASQGDYAGAGYNDYGPFTCWANYVSNLYKWAANTCTEVYDCNHSPAPTTNSPSTRSAVLPPSSVAPSSQDSSSDPPQTPPPSSAAASSQDSSSDPLQTPPPASSKHLSITRTSYSILTTLLFTLSNSTGIPGDSTLSPSTSLFYATNTGGSNTSDSGNPSSSNQSSSNGLAESDHIALGVGIGVGLPGTLATMVGAYYGWKAWKRIMHRSNKDDAGAG